MEKPLIWRGACGEMLRGATTTRHVDEAALLRIVQSNHIYQHNHGIIMA
jgi:hypothetical protein